MSPTPVWLLPILVTSLETMSFSSTNSSCVDHDIHKMHKNLDCFPCRCWWSPPRPPPPSSLPSEKVNFTEHNHTNADTWSAANVHTTACKQPKKRYVPKTCFGQTTQWRSTGFLGLWVITLKAHLSRHFVWRIGKPNGHKLSTNPTTIVCQRLDLE